MSNSNYKYAIREAQSKAKQKEFGIEEDSYPHFKTNSDDLDYSCIFSIIDYAQKFLINCLNDEMTEDIALAATYFDSALNYEDKKQYSHEYLLFGASAYFFSKNFGNSLTLTNRLLSLELNNNSEKRLLYLLVKLLVSNENKFYCEDVAYCKLVDCFVVGKDYIALERLCKEFDDESVRMGYQTDSLFNIIIRAIIKMSSDYLTTKLLPTYTNQDFDEILKYLKSKSVPKILWPAQIKIGESGGYDGTNLIIQSPTGTGKTKSIEFIIASSFAKGDVNNVVIVAPLRSLCNEICNSMKSSFHDVNINSISDILQENDFLFSSKKNILVLTPEKLSYIVFHEPEILNSIDLFIFDEGHMIDDNNRGSSFELLLTHIKNRIKDKQVIFISAVIPNCSQLGDWLFSNKNYQIISCNDLPTTNKHIAVLDNEKRLNFYKINNFDYEDYYVKNSVKYKYLLTKKGKTSTKAFPNKNIDYALYYANLLKPNGSIAIYFGTVKNIYSCLKRVDKLLNSGIELANVSSDLYKDQTDKLLNLIKIHYGENDYYKCAQNGVLIHYSFLEEGLKRTSEFYFKNKHYKVILCTSTLSEGVNLPIKYLIMTEVNNYVYDVSTRKMVNLIGRAARSGVYTDGSIIITCKVRNKNELETKFSDKHSEDCTSCFCDLVLDSFTLFYGIGRIVINEFYCEILNAFQNEDFFMTRFYDSFTKFVESKNYDNNHKNKIFIEFDKLIQKLKSAIDSLIIFIQNSIYSKRDLSKENLKNELLEDLKNTYGYFLMKEEAKERFLCLVSILFDYVYDKAMPIISKYKYIPTCRIDVIEKIIKWSDLNLYLLEENESEFIGKIAKLYYEINNFREIECDDFINILRMWCLGSTFVEISNELDLDISKIEKLCKRIYSYEISMYIGHLIDLIEDDDTLNKLEFIQKEIKYGLPSKDSIKLYEEGVTDRYICQKIFDKNYLIDNDLNVLEFLNLYPDWIKEKYLESSAYALTDYDFEIDWD